MAKHNSGIMVLRNKRGEQGHSYGPPKKIIQSSNNSSMVNFSKHSLKNKKLTNHNRSFNAFKGRRKEYEVAEYRSEYI